MVGDGVRNQDPVAGEEGQVLHVIGQVDGLEGDGAVDVALRDL